MRRWLLAAVLILTIVDCFGQMKRYDTDFFVSQRDFLVAVPLEVERGQFYITLDFNGRSCRFKLDTGASQGVLYDDVQLPGVTTLGTIESEDAEVAGQIEGTTYGSHAMGHFGSERSGRITFLALQRLLWGTFAFHEVHCTTVNGGSHIGAPLLDYGAVVINPFRRQLVFQPYDGMASVTVANRLHNIFIVERNGRAMIGMVRQDSKAWQAGFRSNSIIQSVNGQPLTFEQFLRYRWVRHQDYEFTLLLPNGMLTTLRAFWPLQYNQ